MKIAYFVHDFTDAAIRRRVRMLLAGGATVTLLGFRRGETPVREMMGMEVLDLGQTFDTKLGQRARLVLASALRLATLRRAVAGADVLLARNLEMLVLAGWVQALLCPRARLIYECLDIHWSMTSPSRRGGVLRAVERALLRRCQGLIVSSPAFVSAYFEPFQHLTKPAWLVENKSLVLGADRLPAMPARAAPPGPPWRIGWFGILRAQKALDTLAAIARANPGLVDIVLRGRPALGDFRDFHGQVAATPGMRFLGPYDPEEIAAHYAEIHFTWAFDYLDEGGNSAWLLPNRLYEGGRFGAVPLADPNVETGRWLAARGQGVLFDNPRTEAGPFLAALDQAAYTRLEQRAASLPMRDLISDETDCRSLIQLFRGEGSAEHKVVKGL